MAVLVVAEHDRGALAPSVARVIAAATTLDGEVHVLVAGDGIDFAAAQAAATSGVAKVLAVNDAQLRGQTAEPLAALLMTQAGNYSHIVAASSAVGRDLIPRLAARLDLMPITDVVRIHGPNRFDRPIYAGNAVETVVSSQAMQLLTVRPSAFPPATPGGSAVIESGRASGLAGAVRLIETMRTAGDVPDLSTARIVVGGGVALGSAQNFALIADLASVLGAAIGATRAAVDAGYAPNDWQVGQTGKIIAPELYIAIGISGALQHLAGIQGARKILAINSDPEAPLVKLADYVLIGDLFQVLPALTAALRGMK
jgi:electron transfer flavoprotein alpha subunit